MEEIEQMVLGGILFLNEKKKTGILRMKFINIRNSTFQPYLCGQTFHMMIQILAGLGL
jgi:hypothetical protein